MACWIDPSMTLFAEASEGGPELVWVDAVGEGAADGPADVALVLRGGVAVLLPPLGEDPLFESRLVRGAWGVVPLTVP